MRPGRLWLAVGFASALGTACNDKGTKRGDADAGAEVLDGSDGADGSETTTTETRATETQVAETQATEVDASEVEVEPEITPPSCDPLPEPSSAQIWIDDIHAGLSVFAVSDLVFDREGRAVSVDRSGALVRRSHDGTEEVWLRHVALRARGLAYLSTGELIIADSARGLLVAVYPNDEVRTLVANLDAPGGLDVDGADHLFVAERTRAAVDEIDPKSGKVTTLVAGLRFVPEGLAFAPDFRTLYVTGDDGGLYALHRDADGVWGTTLALVTRLPSATRPCDGKAAHDTCSLPDRGTDAGRCLDDDGELVCVLAGPCTGHRIGDTCVDRDEPGICRDMGDTDLTCVPKWYCDEASLGRSCAVGGSAGTCRVDGNGTPVCVVPGPCDGLAAGDPCGDPLHPGTCEDFGGGILSCTPPPECTLNNVGAPCTSFEGGVCAVQGAEAYCRPPSPCDGKHAGDPCVEWDAPGSCRRSTSGELACRAPDPCDGKAIGDACDLRGQAGRCTDWGDGFATCGTIPPCENKSVGDACVDEFGQDGACVDVGGGGLNCQSTPPCERKSPGDACTERGQPGVCTDDGESGLYCRNVEPCDGKVAGDTCDQGGRSGVCADDGGGGLYCILAQACDGHALGDGCLMDFGGDGLCADGLRGVLVCQAATECSGLALGAHCDDWQTGVGGTCVASQTSALMCAPDNACNGQSEGARCIDQWSGEAGHCQAGVAAGLLYCLAEGCAVGQACTTPEGGTGICQSQDFGLPVCVPHEPCADLDLGARCEGPGHASGTCVPDLDGPRCQLDPACQDKAAGDACTLTRSGRAGLCAAGAGDKLVCQPQASCAGKSAGDACGRGAAGDGTCTASTGGRLFCAPAEAGGTSLAVETDACGNVYLADLHTQALWRVAAAGGAPEWVADVGNGAVTGMAFGHDVAGWDARSIYLAASGGAGIARVSLGFAGRAIVEAATSDARPAGPAVAPAVDCLGLPRAPTSVTIQGKPVGYHDVAFDGDGFIIGYDEANLVAVDHDGNVELWAAGLGDVQGLDWLPDHSLVAATGAGIVQILPNGGQVTLAPDIIAYGLTVGPDGRIYAADNDRVYRVDPSTLDAKVYLDPNAFHQEWRARLVSFDPDASLMYIAENGDSVHVLTLDANLDPIGRPRTFALIRPGVAFLDGMGVDACGNVYLPNYESSALYRVSADGLTSLYHQWTFEEYGHGLEWGSGIGGWRSDAIYLPEPYNNHTVTELVIGAPTGRPPWRATP